ncbi:hypothetical protein SAMN03080617_03002 [Algoriphagus alkaliphilus]|uniref:DUF1569 domain-containing protein n=1 Tax=Algoriphagus alkaliphilus TaxID=279824 RepID=A0A1G5YYD6_9BACT|nr:hypothetical protein [Algoriphagus alkaliphilus]MBA4300963.1 hypothetical protein [Cyclobacterium sp.]SDA87598.1 hypothetical protein SAMN03080617_03002 [Algoriphagus alkaliphilus]
MKNIFDPQVTSELILRVNQLKPESPALWGKMTVDQMLAHCCVAYEMAFTNKHPKPNTLMRFLLKAFVKKGVVNEVPYSKNIRTAPAFIITERKNFEEEKARLINNLEHTLSLGRDHFEGKESLSFGPMTAQEWNNQFYKHLDHHLTQFGV